MEADPSELTCAGVDIKSKEAPPPPAPPSWPLLHTGVGNKWQMTQCWTAGVVNNKMENVDQLPPPQVVCCSEERRSRHCSVGEVTRWWEDRAAVCSDQY